MRESVFAWERVKINNTMSLCNGTTFKIATDVHKVVNLGGILRLPLTKQFKIRTISLWYVFLTRRILSLVLICKGNTIRP